MRLGKDLIGKSIISMTDGRLLGSVKDVYINNQLYWLTGIHVGHEGLIKRKSLLIPRDSVVVFGIDVVLVKNADVITEGQELPEYEEWLRLNKLQGREVDTPGGTKVGTIGDVILGEEGHVTGFALAKVFIEGPIAQQGTLPREALIETGNEDGVMTIDLAKVEQLQQEKQEKQEKQESEL
ncbi:MAG: hypothetical protein GY803_32895 [Chloroflexi bacterium]|nr:hypothetical protein [Chloroflexota bacterium]